MPTSPPRALYDRRKTRPKDRPNVPGQIFEVQTIMNDTRYWRIRIKYGADENLTRRAWEMDEVGIWYGAWGAAEFDLTP